MSAAREVATHVLAYHAIQPHWNRTGDQILPLLIEAAERGHAATEKYQGWANRETWALMLWINNDQGLYETFRDATRGLRGVKSWIAEDTVKDLVEQYFTPDGWYEMTGDAFANAPTYAAAFEIGSLWRIDWAEVTAALLED